MDFKEAGIFEHLAADDSGERVATRKAIAVANKRAKDRFSRFLSGAKSKEDFDSRLALIEDELKETVSSVVNEYGGDPESIEASIKNSLGPINPAALGPAMGTPLPHQQPGGAAWNEQPHMNPGMLTGQPLQQAPAGPPAGPAGSMHPGAGAEAFAGGQAKGQVGSPVGIGMTPAAQRLLQRASPLGSTKEARRPKLCPYHSEVMDISLATGDPRAGFDAMSQHAWGNNHCQGEFEGRCGFKREMVTQKYWDDKAVEAEERKQVRDQERQEIPQTESIPELVPEQDQQPTLNEEMADAPSAIGDGSEVTVGELEPMAASVHIAEAPRDGGGAVKTEDLPAARADGLSEEPSGPALDRSKSGDERGWTLKPVDTQMDGSPNPTIEGDVLVPAKYDKREFKDQTDSVTTRETLPTANEDGHSTEKNIPLQPTKTWSENNNAAPVTSAVDPDKNPIRQVLQDEYDGFVPAHQVQSAIRQFEGSGTLSE